MTTLFISDLHLDLVRPEIIELFSKFVREEAVHADALYILGDLFEAWIGDDAEDETGRRFVEAMRPMREAQRPCFYMHGNRDFLLGERFAKEAGMTLLPDPSVIDLYGTPTLLMHGDTLCTDDVEYQAFRKLSRSPEWQRAFLSKSVEERQAFANQARQESKKHTGDTANEGIMDVNQGAVEQAMRSAKVDRLIHGHTHRPATHEIKRNGEILKRLVLADWYQHPSRLCILKP
ncbi:MAG TPA: UDP-2,3-diacylglucosamine diphosphatase [Dokdonella sp.]|uniref:UDP-2,3-diacylglucosamine diphosphatase n=1 Tax=Dokdonella sp. TaxID=2291710 RepID=UPI002D7F1791|nr:UDP-2,3-diacylglucosamine diphosphatase [Dokdonella sp.]HET9033451.1 UDP-2,3-diacylglucosamine diphosphatase [Dokdonella sp.]